MQRVERIVQFRWNKEEQYAQARTVTSWQKHRRQRNDNQNGTKKWKQLENRKTTAQNENRKKAEKTENKAKKKMLKKNTNAMNVQMINLLLINSKWFIISQIISLSPSVAPMCVCMFASSQPHRFIQFFFYVFNMFVLRCCNFGFVQQMEFQFKWRMTTTKTKSKRNSSNNRWKNKEPNQQQNNKIKNDNDEVRRDMKL